ncbi:uncharacterized protein LOC130759981 [Actinidia eriantha]|uniref:uncharacterized protein LOC130759981 n=1 Tax=Actinidia eriantha TaxID=165200 RepID=UPI00258F13AE|nr:uncharacterized protein LOC130759981 [Actinidia eriantha]
MAIPKLNPVENLLKPKKFQSYSQKGNGVSFWAFLFSIFIYISIFYTFNLSPSSLLNTNKFWFFITNTLILIIAADFSAFSSSRKQADLYEEYVKKSRANSFPPFQSQYREIVKAIIPQQKGENSQESQEKIKEVVNVHKSKFPVNKLELVILNDLEKPSDNYQENMPVFVPETGGEAREEKKIEARRGRRTSDKGIPVINNEKKIILHTSEPEKQEPNEEENEFSTMSDEELNRRVEEFIQSCNRQIRLQAARNRFPLNVEK